jgi:hypothetical protein
MMFWDLPWRARSSPSEVWRGPAVWFKESSSPPQSRWAIYCFGCCHFGSARGSHWFHPVLIRIFTILFLTGF